MAVTGGHSSLYGVAQSPSVAAEWNNPILVVAILSWVAMPLGLLVAVAFYQFLDIDRLFSATLSYSVLAIVGLAMVLGVVPAASHAVSEALGLDPAIGQFLMALGLAAVLVPACRIVRPWIDRLALPASAPRSSRGSSSCSRQIPSWRTCRS